MSMEELDDQTEDARWLAADAQGRNGVADPSDLIAVRSKTPMPARWAMNTSAQHSRMKISRRNAKTR